MHSRTATTEAYGKEVGDTFGGFAFSEVFLGKDVEILFYLRRF